jgi:hypothetical protein
MNEQIRISPVRLIGAGGEQLGVVPTAQPLERAREAGLDLVEMAADERPPVCKILDYSKMRFEASLKAGKNKTRQQKVKEIRVRQALAEVLQAVLEMGAALQGRRESAGASPASAQAGYDAAAARLRGLLEAGRDAPGGWLARFDPAEGPTPVKEALTKVARVLYGLGGLALSSGDEPSREADALAWLGQAAWDLRGVAEGPSPARPGLNAEAAGARLDLAKVWPTRPDEAT